MHFITVLVEDQDEIVVALADIGCVKTKKVSLSRKSVKEVDGCLLERISKPDFAIWCIESKEDVMARMKHAGATIVRERAGRVF